MKIAITGHTKGIGRCIKDLLEKDGHEVVGASTSTGINVMRPKSVISWIEKENPDVFVNNVYAPNSQCNILYQLYEKWQYEDKLIINNLGMPIKNTQKFGNLIIDFDIEINSNRNWTKSNYSFD